MDEFQAWLYRLMVLWQGDGGLEVVGHQARFLVKGVPVSTHRLSPGELNFLEGKMAEENERETLKMAPVKDEPVRSKEDFVTRVRAALDGSADLSPDQLYEALGEIAQLVAEREEALSAQLENEDETEAKRDKLAALADDEEH